VESWTTRSGVRDTMAQGPTEGTRKTCVRPWLALFTRLSSLTLFNTMGLAVYFHVAQSGLEVKRCRLTLSKSTLEAPAEKRLKLKCDEPP